MEQHLPCDLENSNSNLEIPVLPYGNINSLLTVSRQLHHNKSRETMSSVADDSSIDESVSSIGQEEWEKVTQDYDSDIATHESISRVPTPLIDVHDLQQTVYVFPSSPQRLEAQVEDVDTTDGEDDIMEEEGGVESYWDDAKDPTITLPEIQWGRCCRRPAERDSTLPLVKLTGNMAKPYTLNTEWHNQDHVVGAVQMKIRDSPLSLNRPLKLFYLGDESLQGALEAKIGSALVAARRDSQVAYGRRRYSVLPVSWDKESPQVELMPDSGTNMDVETCVAAYEDDNRQGIKVVLQSGEVVSSRHEGVLNKFTVSRGYRLPDLAIIHVSEADGNELSTRLLVRQFLHRHDIPTIVVSSAESWRESGRPLTIDIRSPHFVVQVLEQPTSDKKILKRLPIDVDTFLRLNSLQLNANLACRVPYFRSDRSIWEKFRDTAVLEWNRTSWSGCGLPVEGSIMLAVGLIFLALYALFSANTPVRVYKVTQTDGIDMLHARTTSSPSTKATVLSPSAQAAHITSTATSALQIAPDNELLMPITDLPPKSNSFEAQLYGDNVVIVKPPLWFTGMRRAPELRFSISKGAAQIEHNVTRLNGQMYALSIPKEHAHGLVEVHLRSIKRSKIAVDQRINVDLGSAWNKFFDWMKVINGLTSTTKEMPTMPDSRSFLPYLSASSFVNSTKRAWKFSVNSTLATEVTSKLLELNHYFEGILGSIREETSSSRQAGMQSMEERMSQFKDALSKSTNGLQSKLRRWRETHLQEEQKQLLKVWWRVTGDVTAKETAHKRKPWPKKSTRKARG